LDRKNDDLAAVLRKVAFTVLVATGGIFIQSSESTLPFCARWRRTPPRWRRTPPMCATTTNVRKSMTPT
jgi:hypothetical protein